VFFKLKQGVKMNELLESLDSSVFTAELKKAINEQFNLAVKDAKDEFIAEKAAELEIHSANKIEEKIQELEEKAEEYMAGLEKGINEKEAELEEKIQSYEERLNFLEEKAEEYVDMKLEEMLDNVDKYLDRIVDEFVSEASEKLDESLKSEKADMIIEAFDAMLVATGVEVSKIVEAKDSSSIETELEESVRKYDELVEENINLKSENEKLLKAGVILELKEGLSLVEAQKFERLANIVDFSNGEKFLNKLQTIKESVKSKSEEIVEETQTINEKVEEKIISNKPIWAHLV
jgi:hypothetical protein